MVDIKEKEYQQLRKLGQKLHIPIPEAFWELEVRDKDGKVIQRHKQRSHSWVRNAYNIIYYYLCGVRGTEENSLRVRMTNGTWKIINYVMACSNRIWDSEGNGYRAPAGSDLLGIVVGTGALAEDFESYALASQIANGNGSGQLAYAASEAPVVSTIDTTKRTQWVRYFNNNSGAAITVNEVGLIIYFYYQGGNYLTDRSLIAGGVEVPNTGQLKVTYTIELTYPA